MITAYIKLSDFCDVGCDHCYLPQEVRDDKKIIDDDTIVNVSEDIYQLAKINGTDKVMLLLHGGEVTSLPVELVEKKMMLFESTLRAKGLRCKQSLQTAGLYLNKSWIEYIKTYCDSTTGVSYDPTSRTISNSTERYQSLLSKRLKALRDNECTYGFVIAPSKRELGRAKEIVQFTIDQCAEDVTIDRYSDYGRFDPKKPTNKEHSIFLIELFDEVLGRLLRGENVPPFSSLVAAINGVLFGFSGDRWGTRCLENYIVIDKNGKTNTCPDKISYDESYTKTDRFVISEDRMNSIFEYKLNHKNIYCDGCEYFDWCRTGCPIMKNNPISEGDCTGHKLFLNYIKKQAEDKKIRMAIENYAQRKTL